MKRYVDEVTSAVVPLIGLGQQVREDLDPAIGGVRWWVDHLDTPRRILIGDYLAGLTESTESNLVEAAMHARLAAQTWFAFGTAFATATASGRSVFPLSDHLQNRSVEGVAHVGGFFRALGSVLDNVAGIVVAVAGLQTDLVRADVGKLQFDKPAPRPRLLADNQPGQQAQLALVDAFRSCLAGAPIGWRAWVDGMRNTLVHRARHMSWQFQDESLPDGFARPLPRDPDQTQMEAMARSGSPVDALLDEHAVVSMQGSIGVATNLVRDTVGAAIELWTARRADPDLIRQPHKQWPTITRGVTSGFEGFVPRPPRCVSAGRRRPRRQPDLRPPDDSSMGVGRPPLQLAAVAQRRPCPRMVNRRRRAGRTNFGPELIFVGPQTVRRTSSNPQYEPSSASNHQQRLGQ